ncbi:DUF7437 domain-containing protein [Halorubrum sp. FL23]|uniref:DUF7437 domain-containing protein n=1 Tax=Halorubrum sp. FL23 TaxID=3458704 RepID=UPI004034E3A7
MVVTNAPAAGEDGSKEGTARSFIAASEILVNPDIARVYTDILLNQPTTNSSIERRLDLAGSTTSMRVGKLKNLDIVEDVSSGKESQLRTDSLLLPVGEGETRILFDPLTIAAYGASGEVSEIELFVDRHGKAKLLMAVEQTRAYLSGEVTRRGAADRLNVDEIEAISITQALEPIIALFVKAGLIDDSFEHDVHDRKIRNTPYVFEQE